MRDHLFHCRVGCVLYFLLGLFAIAFNVFLLAALFFILSVVYQVGNFIIQEIRDARL